MNSENKSDTPRTDKAVGNWNYECHEVVQAYFARTLERELNEAKVTIAVLSPSAVGNNLRVQSLEQELSQLRAFLKSAASLLDKNRSAWRIGWDLNDRDAWRSRVGQFLSHPRIQSLLKEDKSNE